MQFKKEETIDTCNNMDESQKPYTECKKSYKKEYMLYDSIYMKFSYTWNWSMTEKKGE